MKYSASSKALGKVAFNLLSQSMETAVANARNSASLCGIDPDDLRIEEAADQNVSGHLDRYGEEWLVDSDEVAALAPA